LKGGFGEQVERKRVVGVLRAPWPFGLGIRVWVTSGKKRVVGVLRAPWPFGLGIRVLGNKGKEKSG
jgi:hypothetical protein